MNILFFANPKSVHDRNWMQFIANDPRYRCFCISRKIHADFNVDSLGNIIYLGALPDFSIIRFWQPIGGLIRIYQLLRKNKIDIFHIIYAEPNALWAMGRTFYKVPMILTTRGTDVLKAIPKHFEKTDLLQKIIQFLYKKSLRSFSTITSTSQRQIDSIKSLGIFSDFRVVRTGVHVEAISKSVERLSIDKPFILFPRLMKPIYNHEFSIAAIGLLSDSTKSSYTMVFLDKDSKQSDYVERISGLIEKSLDVDFLFLDRVQEKELFDLYRQASLCVMNPISDGSPVSAMEAMYFNTPLILGPLEYDADIFGEITKLESWDPSELSGLMEEKLRLTEKPNTKSIILEKGNRQKEMNKLCQIYERLLNQ
ncbi:glycosyltransferase [Marinoscillum furvescens]|uniref:Glycosyltransferase involved in cell wall biosynthesis n=1 Tax=Marinoscillum furvescens DSM 4134 TaxID=1122208 RepID=A0A3D9L378_MARFU|nr:glycosyltransferase [Marinoscillum furvescens]RED99556.1 glycosyltransferase involved in cell wall biosynthesis [Marinoscillum furvescens DSM 4134]